METAANIKPELCQEKLLTFESLVEEVRRRREDGKRIVHCHGVFDLLHIGHMRHLRAARKHGDLLVVTLTPDVWVNKGPHRPAFHEEMRAEALASLECVDYVAINRWPSAVETIQQLRPDFYAKGSEYADRQKDITGGIAAEEAAVIAIGGELVFTDEATFSSSQLLNRHLAPLSTPARQFVESLSEQWPIERILDLIDESSKLRVLTIGETIVDEYHYCETLGAAGKEPILAVRRNSSERFAGGVVAIANHLASFCDHSSLLTFLGERNSHEQFIRDNLDDSVAATLLTMPNAPTITKSRFIEDYPMQKLFEVYEMSENSLDTTANDHFCDKLEELVSQYDLVLVADYGHGMLGPRAIELITHHAQCLAVNTQANAGNHGFNTFSKYPGAHFISVSEKELRLEARNPTDDIKDVVESVASRFQLTNLLVTRGVEGALAYRAGEEFQFVPALAEHFTDRVGAGDAVFAVTSLCAALNAPPEVLGLVGNAVGAMAVQIVGNREPVRCIPLKKFLVSLFK